MNKRIIGITFLVISILWSCNPFAEPIVFEREPVRSVMFYNIGEEVSYNEVVNGEGGEVGVFEREDDVLFLSQSQWRENAFRIQRMGLVFNTVGLEKPKNVTLMNRNLTRQTFKFHSNLRITTNN